MPIHRTNISIPGELNINNIKDRLLSLVQKRMLKFLGHVLKRDGIEILTIQGKVKEKQSSQENNAHNSPCYHEKKIDRGVWPEIVISLQ